MSRCQQAHDCWPERFFHLAEIYQGQHELQLLERGHLAAVSKICIICTNASHAPGWSSDISNMLGGRQGSFLSFLLCTF